MLNKIFNSMQKESPSFTRPNILKLKVFVRCLTQVLNHFVYPNVLEIVAEVAKLKSDSGSIEHKYYSNTNTIRIFSFTV